MKFATIFDRETDRQADRRHKSARFPVTPKLNTGKTQRYAFEWQPYAV